MYYLKPNETGVCTIYENKPEEPFLMVENLPEPLIPQKGYSQIIVSDLQTAWREYRHIPTETDILKEKITELEQLVADLASLQLEVMMNG